MILEQDKETITFGFTFLETTVGLDSVDRVILEDESAEFYTEFRIHVNTDNKEEIHSYFEKHYTGEARSYSNCLKMLICDFFNIPESYEIKRYKAIVGGNTSSVRLNAKKGDVFILRDILLDYGETYKDGIYTIFRNVKDYYDRDENKERNPSFMKALINVSSRLNKN